MGEMNDWEEFKTKVNGLIEADSVDEMTASTVGVLIGKGDNNVTTQTKVASAIKTMLEDFIHTYQDFPEWRKEREEWRKERENEERLEEEKRQRMEREEREWRAHISSIDPSERPGEEARRITRRLDPEYFDDEYDWDDVVRNVAEDLGEIKDDVAVLALLKLLKSGDWDPAGNVGSAIVEALGKIGDEAAVEALCELAEHDVVIIALGNIGSSEAVPTLISKAEWNSTPPAENIALVIEALGKIGDHRAIPVLTKLLEDDTADVRQEAMDAIKLISWEESNSIADDFWRRRT